jgi:hypothetical protein
MFFLEKTRAIVLSAWIAALGGVSILAAQACADTPLLQDNFNDNSIDFSKWAVVTTNIPQNPKSVLEQNGRIELEGRAHFNTAMQFEPTAQPGQGFRITGQWTFVSNDDFMQILTRSDGQPNPGNCCGETTSGIEFFVGTQAVGGNMSISNRGGTTVTGQSNSGALNPVAGETYNFEIRDTGTNLYFTMSQVGGSKQRTVVASSLTNTPTDVISFHNRESGRRSNIDNLVIDSPSLLGPTSAAYPILLQDNFDDNSLDASKWNAVTAGIPQAGASVVEANSRLQMTGRGHLVSAQQFDPADGGIRVEGRWTFGSDDFMQVLTRSDGQPSGGFGETLNGIEFFAFDGNDQMSISQRVNGVSTNLGTTAIDISAGDVFDFLITDDGDNLLFQLTQVGGDGTTAQLVGASSQSYAQNFLAFHNRESGRVAFLDDVVVSSLQAVPEPASVAIWLFVGVVTAGTWWKRRCRVVGK